MGHLQFHCWKENTTENFFIGMKICLVLIVILSFGSASPQFGFLGDLVGGLLGTGNSNNRPSNNNGRRPNGGGGGSGGCRGGHQPNHRFGGKDYLISWRYGCSTFTQSEAENFCRNQNPPMQPISIDSSAKQREFLDLVSREKQRFFWTGGKMDGRSKSITWP